MTNTAEPYEVPHSEDFSNLVLPTFKHCKAKSIEQLRAAKDNLEMFARCKFPHFDANGTFEIINAANFYEGEIKEMINQIDKSIHTLEGIDPWDCNIWSVEY